MAKKFGYYALNLLVCLLLLYNIFPHFFGSTITYPNHAEGDGIKNYYTIIYHVLYNSNPAIFNGFNYPFKENIIFTDGTPLLSMILQQVHRHIVTLTPDSIIGIYNFLLFLSAFLASIYTQRIMEHYKVPPLWACLFAPTVIFLNSQIMRWMVHFALGFLVTIPFVWYHLVKFNASGKLLHIVKIILFVSCIGLIHLYYIPILGLSAFLFLFLQWLFNSNKIKQLVLIVYGVLIIAIPFIITKLYIFLYAFKEDRPQSPFGFLDYTAQFKFFFMPICLPISRWLNEFFNHQPNITYEGWVFIPTLTVFLIFSALVYCLIRIIKTMKLKANYFNLSNAQNYLISFLVAIILLLIAFGYPFSLFPQNILDSLGIIKQFRSLARFAWVSSILFNTLSIVFLFYLILLVKNKILKLSIILTALGLNYYDAFSFGKEAFKYCKTEPLLKDKIVFKPDSYQAIIAFPFFHIGSENMAVEFEEQSIKLPMCLSMQTGLPNIASMMSRSSISEALFNISLIYEPVKPLQSLLYCDKKKDFIILVTDSSKLKTSEKEWVKKSQFLGKYQNGLLYHLEYDSFAFFGKFASNYIQNIYQSSIRGTEVCHKTYNHNKRLESYKGGGGEKANHDQRLYLLDTILPVGAYKGSVWVMMGKDLISSGNLVMELYNKDSFSHQGIWQIRSYVTTFDKLWGLVEFDFYVPDYAQRIVLYGVSLFPDKNKQYFMDELLIRKQWDNIIMQQGSEVMINNRFYTKEQLLLIQEKPL